MRFRLQTKLLLAFLVIGALAIWITGWQAYENARGALEEATYARLLAVRESKKREIQDYFAEFEKHLQTLSRRGDVRDAVEDMGAAFHAWPAEVGADDDTLDEYRDAVTTHYENVFAPRLQHHLDEEVEVESYATLPDPAIMLQYFYIVDNHEMTGEKHNLDASENDESRYTKLHAQHHPQFRAMLERYALYDIFLIDKDGNVIYTVVKEVDVGTNLVDGPYAGSGFGEAVRRALATEEPGAVTIADFSFYDPSYHAPAAFMAVPIHRGDEVIGAFAIQVSIEEMDRVMTGERGWRYEGLGETGETYLVGPDFRMRSDSRFLLEEPYNFFRGLLATGVNPSLIDRMQTDRTSILYQEVRSDAAADALKGISDTKLITDYRGEKVLSSFTPVDIPGLQWALLAEIDETEAFKELEGLQNQITALTLVLTLVFALNGYIFAATQLSRPIHRILEAMRAVGDGDLERRAQVQTRDELALVASGFNAIAAQLEDASRASGQLRAVLDAQPEALFVVDHDPDDLDVDDPPIHLVNRAAGNLLMVRPEELRGRPISVALASGLETTWWRRIVRGGGKRLPLEAKPRGKAPVPVLVSAVLLKTEEGETTGFVLTAESLG